MPRIDLKKYNVIIDGRNFYDNPIESDIEKYRELKKVMTGKGEDYTTGSLLDYNCFNKHYKLVAVHLSKQKELDTDPRAIQQIEFKYMLETNSTIYWVLEKSKETILEFYKGTVSSVKWTVLAHLESQPRGQNFQTQNLVDRSSPPYTRFNKILINTFKIN